MTAVIIQGLISAGINVLSRVATQAVFEVFLTKIIIYAGERLVKMTTNDLDDALLLEIKKSLKLEVPKEGE